MYPPSEGQWQLVWKQFRRRKLAVASGLLILFLFTVAVFAPLLANGEPLWYRGYNRYEYQEALRNLRNFVLLLGKPGQAPEARSRSLAAVRVQGRVMSAYLPPESRAELQELLGRVEAVATDDAQAEGAGSSRELVPIGTELRQKFDARKVALVSRNHWPVRGSLIALDIAFMVFNVMLLLFPLWNRLLMSLTGREATRHRRNVRLALFLGLPLVAGLAWWLAVPPRIDRTPYSRGVMADAESELVDKAPVVFEQVMWAPVPFALDGDDLNRKYAAPSAEHPMGTDEIGRDVMSRMIWGGRVSLAVGVLSVSIYVTIGIIVGSLAGYFRGTWDLLISRVIEVVICFPSFFLILTIVAFLGPSIFNIMIVIGVIGWTGIAQLVRGEFLRLGEQEFIIAGRALGYSPLRIIFRHVLPNALAPVLVSATFGIAGAILTESALSFLGFGITLPRPSWGGILSSGRDALTQAPWLIYFPGLAIFLTITAYNLVGEALRDAADPRLRGRQ